MLSASDCGHAVCDFQHSGYSAFHTAVRLPAAKTKYDSAGSMAHGAAQLHHGVSAHSFAATASAAMQHMVVGQDGLRALCGKPACCAGWAKRAMSASCRPQHSCHWSARMAVTSHLRTCPCHGSQRSPPSGRTCTRPCRQSRIDVTERGSLCCVIFILVQIVEACAPHSSSPGQGIAGHRITLSVDNGIAWPMLLMSIARGFKRLHSSLHFGSCCRRGRPERKRGCRNHFAYYLFLARNSAFRNYIPDVACGTIARVLKVGMVVGARTV